MEFGKIKDIRKSEITGDTFIVMETYDYDDRADKESSINVKVLGESALNDLREELETLDRNIDYLQREKKAISDIESLITGKPNKQKRMR